jgi:hypothetical protein
MLLYFLVVFLYYVGTTVAYSVQRLATGWTIEESEF